MIFKFEPQYMQRVWGGTSLETALDRNLGNQKNIGESWEIVDREENQSTLLKPKYQEMNLRKLLAKKGTLIMGPNWHHEKRFPLLVKWLDCKDRLSLQVHPPAAVAKSLGGEPKTENWYVAHATKDAGLFAGFKKGTSKEQFIESLDLGTAESHCHRINSQKGDSLLVESGRIHAIDAGNLILEIQQNSDTTYRVYDWDRKGLDGNPRQLHLEESLRCIDFNDFEPKPLRKCDGTLEILSDCPHFRIRKFIGCTNECVVLKARNQQCMILNPIGCDIKIDGEMVRSGFTALSPYCEECVVTFMEGGELLVTDNFYI